MVKALVVAEHKLDDKQHNKQYNNKGPKKINKKQQRYLFISSKAERLQNGHKGCTLPAQAYPPGSGA